MSKKLVLVMGSTGNQGGAVARALLADGHKVRALSRRLDSPRAKALTEKGIELVEGDFDNTASLDKAISGVDAVFVMGTPFGGGIETEIRQASAVVDAAKKAGTSHVIYSSVSDADKNTGIPHFDSKYKVEQHVASIGVPYTIVGPVYFLENLFFPHILDAIKQGTLGQQLPGNRKLQVIPIDEIGKFVSLVIDCRDTFLGKRFNIASDELTGNEMAKNFSEIIGKNILYTELPMEPLRKQSEDMALMYEWFNNVGYTADIKQLRKEYSEVGWRTFKEWATSQKWN